jgi:outer membrane autotransporter protein
VSWVHIQTAGLAESGGPAALLVGDSATDTTSSTLGIRIGTTQALADGIAILPRVSVAWQHAFGDADPTASLAFRSGSSPFLIAGAPLARDSALVDAGIDLAFGSQGRIGIAYGGTWSDSVADHSVKGNATWRF